MIINAYHFYKIQESCIGNNLENRFLRAGAMYSYLTPAQGSLWDLAVVQMTRWQEITPCH